MKSNEILAKIYDDVLNEYSICLVHLSVEEMQAMKSYLDKQLYNYVVTKMAENRNEQAGER